MCRAGPYHGLAGLLEPEGLPNPLQPLKHKEGLTEW